MRRRISGRRRYVSIAAATVVALVGARTSGSQVVQLQGGGSSLFGGYGVAANFWGSNYDGWFGVGRERDWRLGGLLRLHLADDTLRLGDDAIRLNYPTDVLGTGYNVLTQGAAFAGSLPGSRVFALAGASASGAGAYLVPGLRAARPLGLLVLQNDITPALTASTNAAFARRQTVLEGLRWSPSAAGSAAMVAGVGANHPYEGVSATVTQDWLDARASYNWVASGFRRADVPAPSQTELGRENVAVTVRPTEWFALTGTWQNFVHDSSDLFASQILARGASLVAHATLLETQLSAGGYDSRTAGATNRSEYVAAGRMFADVFGVDLYLLHSASSTGITATNPVATLHERFTQRLTLSQMITGNGRQATVAFGGSYAGDFGDIDAEYQILHTPFDVAHPFQRALSLTARLQFFGYTAGVGTSVGTNGAVSYSASAGTFLYLGEFNGGEPQPVVLHMPDYIVRGVVRDEHDAPIAGAAIQIGSDTVFSNSEGAFFVRKNSARSLPVSVVLDQFLTPTAFEVIDAPTTATPVRDDAPSEPLRIVLRRRPSPPVVRNLLTHPRHE